MNLQEMQVRLSAITTECETLSVAGTDETPEAKTARTDKFDALLVEGEKLQGDIEKEKARTEKLNGISKTVETLRATPVNTLPQGGVSEDKTPKIEFKGYSGKLACNSESDAYWTGVYYQY